MPSKKQAELDIVCQEVADCKACVELASTRNKTVFGVGNANARLVFYGEAPALTRINRASHLSDAPGNC